MACLVGTVRVARWPGCRRSFLCSQCDLCFPVPLPPHPPAQPENLLVPLHAYPIMNETKFPTRIDFGKCAVGDTVTKRFKMECKVPIEFEYSIKELRANPCFRVSPMSGIVPAHGHVVVEVSFAPTMLRTEELQLEVSVAEFKTQPVVCTVTGSCLPGVAKERLLKGATGSPSPDMALLDGTLALKEASHRWPANKGGGYVRGGAGGGDAFTMSKMTQRLESSTRDCRKTGPIISKPPRLPAPPGEVEVGGLYLPDGTLTAQSDIAYVLNQQQGKLRIKDIKHAIAGKKAEMEVQHEELAAIMADDAGEGGAGIHPLERPEVPAHIKVCGAVCGAGRRWKGAAFMGGGAGVGRQVASKA